MQSDDQMVSTYLKMLSLRPMDEIEATLIEHAKAPERRLAQRELAYEMTSLVHGKTTADGVEEAAAVLFGADPAAATSAALAIVAGEAPSVDLPASLDGTRVHELVISAGLAKSTSEVGRLLVQGAIRAGNRVLEADGLLRASDLLTGGFLLIRKGKKDFFVGKTLTGG
jgi:tyrosyl-tRNA synthetase